MAVSNSETSKRPRLSEALLTRSDIGVTELVDKLKQAEAYQAAGQLAEAAREYNAAGQFYALRAQHHKAVQVLRQAARCAPDDDEIQVQLGESLGALKLVEDAAQAYRRAAQILESQSRIAEFLDVVQRMLNLDPGDLHGRLRLAEAMSRAGRTAEAAQNFQALAEALLSAGESDDWEKVAERLLHHDAGNATVAHDLALHYVRSGRYALALPKLILCYELEPGDAELIDLIIDTLQNLGQREKAATICRQLLATLRKTGLAEEADRTLQRLYHLDPDDAEARDHVAGQKGAVAGGTVLEFEAAAAASSKQPAVSAPKTPTERPVAAKPTPAAAPSTRASGHRPRNPVAEDDFDGETAYLPVNVPNATQAVTNRQPLPRSGAVTGRPPSGTHPARTASGSFAARPAAVPALEQLASTVHDEGDDEQDWPSDEEAGFDGLDRTIVQDVVRLSDRLPAPSGPQLTWGANPSPAPPPAARPLATPAASMPSAQQPVVSPRARSGTLPRPRLARHAGTMSELPATARDLAKDLGTLDFFIERGFYDSAVALLEELQRRHPESLQVRAYRQRVDKMSRT
ncbi:MAG: tetratricopeptide repeat protein [Deltaproteobacteria bacterium]|nr:tetratricopeptide repeat protein [Deltaproteobacteria bacterium]